MAAQRVACRGFQLNKCGQREISWLGVACEIITAISKLRVLGTITAPYHNRPKQFF